MSIPLFKPSRCVLLIGDEALYVYDVKASGARLVDTVPWQAEDFQEIVVDLIRKECGSKPVMVLNDMTDQHFKGGQRIPKVGAMDKANVLRRKVQVAFPNYPIRGALPIKAPPGDKGPRTAAAGGLYLFAAVPVSEPIMKTVTAVKMSMAPIAGFFLLPLEASDMVQAMAEKLSGRGRSAPRWAVFIGQHQNGDLRQVITRDGQLAMTRMTSVVDSDGDPDMWAAEVYQEFKATLSYLSRFGYSAEDGMEMIVITNQQGGEALERMIDIECNFHAFTAPEAGRLVGVNVGIQDDSRYADPLHAAWAGRKTKFVLPMEVPDLVKVNRPRQAAAAAAAILLASGAYFGWQALAQANAMMSARSELTTEKTQLARAQADYETAVARMNQMGYDIKLIQGSMKTYGQFERERVAILPLLAQLSQGLGNDLRIDTLSVSTSQPKAAPAGQKAQGGEAAPQGVAQIDFTINFPTTINPEEGIREINNLQRRLQGIMPKYRVTITRQVASPEYTASAQGVAGEKKKTSDQDKYLAALSIRGPVQ
jgi:hypothetical protein